MMLEGLSYSVVDCPLSAMPAVTVTAEAAVAAAELVAQAVVLVFPDLDAWLYYTHYTYECSLLHFEQLVD